MDRLLGGWGAIFFFFFLSFLVTGLSETENYTKKPIDYGRSGKASFTTTNKRTHFFLSIFGECAHCVKSPIFVQKLNFDEILQIA